MSDNDKQPKEEQLEYEQCCYETDIQGGNESYQTTSMLIIN